MTTALTQTEIQRKLTQLDGWEQAPRGIRKQYVLNDFRSVVNLVNRVADLAEEANHHPCILIDYDRVTFTLTTHDAGGITEKDFDLAARIEAIAP
jgi:4a-hydroxytetrahydrobiopterin dehydratase